MAAFSDYLETALLNHVLRNAAYASPGLQVWVALFDGDPGEAGVGATECSFTGYARQQVTAWDVPAGGATQNTNPITFGPCTLGFPANVAGVGIFDANAGGNLLYHGPATARTLNAGDSYQFAAGQLDVAHQ